MSKLELRIAKLEESAGSDNPAFSTFIACLPPLNTSGELEWSDGLAFDCQSWLQDIGQEARASRNARTLNDLELGLALLLGNMLETHDPFVFESYRAIVPNAVLAWLYNDRRNWAYDPATQLRIRQLAGVVDAQGKTFPGYVVSLNGCILDVMNEG